jgi:hypothetical protein
MHFLLLVVLTVIPKYFYNVSDTATVKGEVLSVEREQIEGSEVYHVVLSFKSVDTTLKVVLGPAWFIEEIPRRGDSCVVSGSVFRTENGIYFIARKLFNSRTKTSMSLRTESGFPLWYRQRASERFMNRAEGGQNRQRQRQR